MSSNHAHQPTPPRSHNPHLAMHQITTDESLTRVLSASVQQAFLSKFENEGQAAATADQIVEGASKRYMVVTVKHSGSLVTLSAGQVGDGVGWMHGSGL